LIEFCFSFFSRITEPLLTNLSGNGLYIIKLLTVYLLLNKVAKDCLYDRYILKFVFLKKTDMVDLDVMA